MRNRWEKLRKNAKEYNANRDRLEEQISATEEYGQQMVEKISEQRGDLAADFAAIQFALQRSDLSNARTTLAVDHQAPVLYEIVVLLGEIKGELKKINGRSDEK